MRKCFLFYMLLMLAMSVQATERQKLNFNADWQLHIGDIASPIGGGLEGASWQQVTLPYAFNGDEAFRKDIVDKQGRRCPLDDRMVHFSLWGEGKWIGGIASGRNDNYVGAMSLPVECGINRVLVRTTTTPGDITLSACADGLKPAYITVPSMSSASSVSSVSSASSVSIRVNPWPFRGHKFLDRGPTPLTPSYTEQACGIDIVSASAGYDSDHAVRSYDDNELSEWKNDGRLSTAWITYHLATKTIVDDICLKLTGWRLRSYPLEIYSGRQLIWSGETERSLGYIHLTPTKRIKTDEITIRLKGAGKDNDAFGGIVEVAEPTAGELDLFKAKNASDTKNELRIVEIEFLEARNTKK